jgi:hypothetical protein
MEFFILVTWLVLSIAAAVYANNKGRSGGGIFLLSLFLSPLVGFLVAAAMEPHAEKIAEAKGMKFTCGQAATLSIVFASATHMECRSELLRIRNSSPTSGPGRRT